MALPKSLRDIERLIGTEKTLEIVGAFGGQKLTIPSRLNEDWLLLPMLGTELGLRLIDFCGGSQLRIPICKSEKALTRNQQIMADRANGLTLNALTTKYGLANTTISAILNSKQKSTLSESSLRVAS